MGRRQKKLGNKNLQNLFIKLEYDCYHELVPSLLLYLRTFQNL